MNERMKEGGNERGRETQHRQTDGWVWGRILKVGMREGGGSERANEGGRE